MSSVGSIFFKWDIQAHNLIKVVECSTHQNYTNRVQK